MENLRDLYEKAATVLAKQAINSSVSVPNAINILEEIR
jgi:uncharacterized protein (UPF0147 family)